MKPIFRFPLLVALPLIAAGCTAANSEAPPTDTATSTQSDTTKSDTTKSDTTAADTSSETSTSDSTTSAADTGAADTGAADTGAAMKSEADTAAASKTYRKAEMPPGAPDYVAAMKKVAVPMPPQDFKVAEMPRLKVTTNKGSFTLQLNAKEAPLHTKSFVYLAKRGFYDGTVFHRHADLTGQGGFIIQGGDPLSKTAGTREYAGRGGPGYEVPREHNKLTHEKLVIAMARSNDPDSAGSQFYITQAAVPFLDTMGDGYTVFGKVVQGGDVALKLSQDDTIKKIEVLK